MNSHQNTHQSRIPEQQSIGQTLPPVPVGVDTMNAPPLPFGAMPMGTHLQVGRYQVVIHNFIAEGGFAHVYLARIEGKTGFVVLKRVAVPDTEALKTVEKEIAFMRRLGEHKNITRYYESRIDVMPMGGFEALILMEYCGGVIDLMNRRLQQRLTEPEIIKIFSDVCEALAYMHYCSPPVLHRDLKVENILILSQDHYKLCDFGSAALSRGNYVPSTIGEVQRLEEDIQRHTTLQYRAPEMIDIYQKRPINEKADIWALGVLLYKLCYYTTPFEEQGQLATLNARYTIPSQPAFSDKMRRLICSMLQEDQNHRPNIYQVMNAVCQIRGIECPIRNIYGEPASPPHPPTKPTNGSAALFESINIQPEIPSITPMRRGRPTRENAADPFEPSKQGASSVQTNNSSKSTNIGHHQHSVSLGFESDFKPSNSPLSTPPKPTATNIQLPKDSKDQKDPKEPKDPYRPNSSFRDSPPKADTPSTESPLKYSYKDPSSPPKGSPASVNSLPVKITPKPSKSMGAVPSNKTSDTNESFKDTSVRHTVTANIEARLQAFKGQSNNGDESVPFRPKPPPKPARFRATRLADEPSLTEFEGKFPSVEELAKHLPVNSES
ncbi:kinase-like domain-containing protein [Phycomyces nitens]|nr:kinase-like domain-containing protein [Phycomyces nitens]